MKQTITACIASYLIFGCVNLTFSATVTETFTYQSTLTSDANGPLDLIAELNYDDSNSSAPIAVVMHGYSGVTGKAAEVRANAQRLRDYGFFAISVALRERDGSDGTRDSGGIEIYDIYDAVEAVKATYPSLVNPEIVYITGYSGGGGNTMSVLTKFPDYFNAGAAFFGMSDYGYDTTDGWYFNGAGSRTSQLDIDIGDPTPPAAAAVTDRYHARASNLASVNNPYSEIHLFVNDDETICPPVNCITYKSNALENASFEGEFTNITVHIGNSNLYEDFDGDEINDSNEQQYWVHGGLTADSQYAAEHWFMDRLLAGQISKPVLNTNDSLFVAGFVKTAKFSCFVGDGQEGAVQLDYDLTSSNLTFQTTLLSLNTALTSSLTVNTEQFEGRKLEAFTNNVSMGVIIGGQDWSIEGLTDGDTLELRDIGPAVIWWNEENTSSITPTSAVANATLNGDTSDVWLYYGTSSAGQQKDGWAFTNHIGSSVETGIVSSTLSELSSDESYYYVFYATNTTEEAEAWSTVETFTTQKADIPEAPLKIDFNDNDSGSQPTQEGYIGIMGSGGTVESGYGVNDEITISLTAGLDDRDRGALTGGAGLELSDLLRDFIFGNTGTGLGITISTLEAGKYKFTGFFHDLDHLQPNGTLGVDVGDGNGEVLIVTNFTYSTGTSPSVIGKASISFIADGTNPVIVWLRDTTDPHVQPYCINGFTLEKSDVPERVGTLVAYYDFEDDLTDSSGNSNHGTAGGNGMSFSTDTPTALTDSTESADFDGNGYVTLPYLGLYNQLAAINGLTVSLWFKSEASTGQSWFLGEGYTLSDNPGYLFGHGASSTRPTALIRNLTGSLPLNTPTETAQLYNGNWHHWVWTDKKGIANMYIDGVPVAAASGSWDYTHAAIPFDTTTIGAWIRDAAETRTYPLIGQIDDVSIWNSVLSSNEVSMLYAGTSPREMNLRGGMSNIVFETAQPYIGQTAVYQAGFIPDSTEESDIVFDLAAFGTGADSGMDLASVSSSITDYTFSGFSSNPTTVTVDNINKLITFTGGTTASNAMHTIEAVPGTSGWLINNPGSAGKEFVEIRTNSKEGVVDVAVIDRLPDSKLVAYYTFENHLMDATTNHLNGTNSGGVTFTSDTPTELTDSTAACDFDGSSYISLPYIGMYNNLAAPGTEGLTVSIWIKSPSSSASAWILSEGNTGSTAPVYCFGNISVSGIPRTYFRNDSNYNFIDLAADSATTPSAICDGSWHNWIWTDYNGEAKMYIDGKEVTSNAEDGSWGYTRSTLTMNTTTIGALIRTPTADKYPFDGQIDDVSIWRTVLREGDIRALASGMSPEGVIDGFDHKLEGTVILVF